MFPDRELQIKLLKELKSFYPKEAVVETLSCYSSDPDFMANIFYLQDLEYIDGDELNKIGQPRTIFQATITWRGIDFLEGDGGLSHVLDKIMIVVHRDEIYNLFVKKLAATDLSREEKENILDAIKLLPIESIQSMYAYLLNLGLKNLDNSAEFIQGISKLSF